MNEPNFLYHPLVTLERERERESVCERADYGTWEG